MLKLDTVDMLKQDGITLVRSMPLNHVDAFKAFLAREPRYAQHVERDRKPYEGGDVCCWSMESVLAAPFFFEYAMTFAETASLYLDTPSRLYSVNVFETFPSEDALNPDIQEFHRDRDDVRFLALFVYLTDVLRKEDGAHQYRLGTHTPEEERQTERELLEQREVVNVTGVRGTAFLTDGRGTHRGLRPTARPRAIAWARWGVSDRPASYVWDGMKPVSWKVLGSRYPSDPAAQRSIELVVR